jgi:hypothetical protein
MDEIRVWSLGEKAVEDDEVVDLLDLAITVHPIMLCQEGRELDRRAVDS